MGGRLAGCLGELPSVVLEVSLNGEGWGFLPDAGAHSHLPGNARDIWVTDS